MPNFVNYDGTEVTKLLLFGTTEVPLDFNLRVRQIDAATPTITYNADEFLEVGGGRYAWVARANIVEFFFTQYPNLPTDRSFSLDELIAEMSANHGYEPRANSGDQFIPLNQYATNAPTDDYAERAYIFGSGAADLTQATFVVAADGTRTIDDIIVQPRADGFDFQSDNNVVQLINDTYLKPTIDPSELAEDEVVIQWTDASVLTFPSTNGETTTYTQARYEFDKQDQANLIAPDFSGLLLGAFSPNGSLNYIGGHLQADPILSFEELGYWGELKSVKYLGNGDDDQTIFENADDIILVGNTQNNRFILADIDGSEIYGGSGNDTVLIANIGGHFVDGHDDFDTVEYGNTIATALAGIRGEALGEKLNVSTNSAANLQDLLVNVEALLLTDYDDAFTFSGEFSAIANGDFESVSAGESVFEQMGDTLVLNTTQGVDVDLSNLSASVGPDAITVVGFENVIGSNFADTIRGDGESNEISGGSGSDIILGGGDADTIDGGSGNDFIVGGAGRDTIDGGSGWDVLSYANYDDGAPTGVTVDLYDRELDPDADPASNTDASVENIEVFIGSSQGDEFIGSQGGGEWFAGGEGNDTFTISRFASGNGPTVIWGGGGEDTIRISSERYISYDGYQRDLDFTELGILLVDVPDVTEENFHTLNFADLGLDPGFLYYGFDAIIINHEARDTVVERREGFEREAPPWNPVDEEGEGEGGPPQEPLNYGYFDQEIATVSVTEIISPYVQSLEGFNPEVTLVDRRGFGTDALVDPHVPGEAYAHPRYQRTKTIVADYHTFGIGDVDDGDYQEFTIFGGAAELGLRFSGLGLENTTLRNTSTSVDDYYFGAPLPIGSEEYNALRRGMDVSDFTTFGSPFGLYFDTLEEYPTLTNIVDFGGDRSNLTNASGSNDSWYIVGGSADENGITTAGAPETYTLSTEDNSITERLDALLGRSSSVGLIIDGTYGNDIINTSYQGPNGGSVSDEGQTINGFGGNDTITAGAGNDTINGGTQYDTIYAGDGDDVVAGDNGRDTVYLGNGNDIFNDNNQTGTHSLDTVYGGNGEDIINGGGGDDTFYGDSGDDLIFGGDGNDTIYGGSYYDTIHGGAGDDQVWGDNGRDTVYLGDGNDIFNDNTQTGTHSLDTVYAGNGNDTINGGGGDDTFYGDSGDDLIFGGDGNDTIYGGSYYDTIHGGAGDDQVWGDNGRDTVYLEAGDDVFNDNTQTGTHSLDTVFGGDGNDTINGGGGDDTFAGDAGDDTLTGGIGNDLLTGGLGADTFLFNDGDGADVVTDFDFSVDTIEVNGVAVDATALASGVSLVQAGADVTLSYGSGDTVTLQDVDLSAWDGSTGNAVIGQAGTATVTQGNSEQWFTVTFDQAITDAVVVLGPVEFNGSDPTTTRVRNVDDDGFEFQIDEWNYRDGGHIAESVGWMAVSAGHHTLANGVTIVAGVTQVNSTFETVNFGTTLTDAIVLSEVTTVLESDAVTTRHQNVTDTSFDVRLQEEEALGDHVDEDVSWIAIETGSYDGFEAVRTPNQVDEVADQFVFNSSFAETPVLLGDFQTFNGPDTSTMRFNDLDANGVTLRLQEEASRDTELGHTNEVAGYLAIDDGWFV